MIGALPEMFPAIAGSEALDTYVKISFFIGSVFFTVAGYAQLFEAMNVDLDMSTDVQYVIDQKLERSTDRPVKQVRKLSWFKWRGDRLGFLASFVQSVGTVVFNVNCFFAIFIGLGWITEDLLVWVPSTIASTLFITARYLFSTYRLIVVTAHRTVCTPPAGVTYSCIGHITDRDVIPRSFATKDLERDPSHLRCSGRHPCRFPTRSSPDSIDDNPW